MRLISILLCVLILAVPVRSQENDTAPLVVPFLQIPPFSYRDSDGERAGFFVSFARQISAEIGVPIEYLDVPDSNAFTQAQISGESQLIPGILQLAPIAATSVFSDVVAVDQLRPAVRADSTELVKLGVLTNRRVGIVPPAMGSQHPVLEQNTAIPFATPQGALMELLAGRVDAVLAPSAAIQELARDAGFDGQIRFIGEPLLEATRHIALHESRAELLEPINDAIARMEADGRLETLRQRYNIEVPTSPPDVLSVAVAHFPPHLILDDDGTVSGFIPDAVRELAERASLEIEFVTTPQSAYVEGPAGTGTDLVAGLVDTPDRRELMDFSLPVRQVVVEAVFTGDDAPSVSAVSDLQDLKVGVLAGSIVETVAQGPGTLDIVPFENNAALLNALLGGSIDAAMAVAGALESEGGTTAADTLRAAEVAKVNTAIALRFGLGSIREKLDVVIPGFLVSQRYNELRETYYGQPVFWTRTRVIAAFAAGTAGMLLVVGAAVFHNMRVRVRAAAEMSSVRRELETIFNAATSGIVALSADGQILRINNRARHFLGGISGEPPFAWPESIKFLEAETMTPLDNSADPIQRALSGHNLHNQTHLLRRFHAIEAQRYVRVDNASLDDPESGIRTVLVIDDVSEQERNRQVVERKSRLDALGQLTGGIAHDFNNLLASQLYSVSLARKAKDPEKRDKYLEVTENSINRGRSLTSRLLAFAKKQPGLSSVRKTADVIDDFEKLIRPMLEEKIEISFELEDDQLRHFCDQTQLETALMNLVLNSRDAILRGAKGNRIEIRARPVRAPNPDLEARQSGSIEGPANTPGASFRYVEFSVTDNGPGMDEETKSRCTDPFFTTKNSNSGTGLGLAMVYGFVRHSEGDLRIYSELGVGTTVKLTLPRGAEDGLRERPMPEAAIERGRGQTIFVVEDEPQLLMLLSDTLEDLGYNVISASSGAKAMRMVEAGVVFDLLLTDIVMPDSIGGFELARRVRQVYSEIPVVYMSGYTGFTASEMGEVQAPLLQKPAPPIELAKAIQTAMGSE
ncbi:transporter substrate-binding domain-containing protein [Roseobacter sp. S98]|uniref:transporter substrate-binding domain-containing protein n=1 Tax=Roseobacter algicola (ex Choi et al. 2025) (nom. illeg.) TaxID=3092138 RepID=UPI003F50FCAE